MAKEGGGGGDARHSCSRGKCLTILNGRCQFWQSLRSLSMLITHRIVRYWTGRGIAILADVIFSLIFLRSHLSGDALLSRFWYRDA